MYEAKYPEVDMAVMIQVKNIADMGAYVSLLEYNNIAGDMAGDGDIPSRLLQIGYHACVCRQ